MHEVYEYMKRRKQQEIHKVVKEGSKCNSTFLLFNLLPFFHHLLPYMIHSSVMGSLLSRVSLAELMSCT